MALTSDGRNQRRGMMNWQGFTASSWTLRAMKRWHNVSSRLGSTGASVGRTPNHLPQTPRKRKKKNGKNTCLNRKGKGR